MKLAKHIRSREVGAEMANYDSSRSTDGNTGTEC